MWLHLNFGSRELSNPVNIAGIVYLYNSPGTVAVALEPANIAGIESGYGCFSIEKHFFVFLAVNWFVF